MRSISLGLSIAVVVPVSLANATLVSMARPAWLSKSNIQLMESTCDRELSTNRINTVSPKKQVNSNFWLSEITKLLLPNILFSDCPKRLPLTTWYDQKPNYPWQNEPDGPQEASRYRIARDSIQSFKTIDLSLPTNNLSCISSRQWQLIQALQVKSSKKLASDRRQETTDDSFTSKSLPKFPKLSRSSLIVSFPEENSSFVPNNTKFANPAPETRRIASPFGWRKRPYSNQLQFHQGIDYGAPYGSPVVAVGNGIVTRIVSGCADFGNLFCGGQLGNWIEIDHGDGAIATYGHLKNSSITVKEGMKVSKNQEIARVGSSGWSTGAHLDFRLKVDGKHENPADRVMAIDNEQSE